MEYVVARFDDELYHYGVKGMKWGVRRTKEALARLSNRRIENKKRRERIGKDNQYARYGNANDHKKGRHLSRKMDKFDSPEERKKRIDADMKEADERVKFYGSKRAAKVAIEDEARYAQKVNNGKALTDTALYGGLGGITMGTILGGAAETGAAALFGFAAPLVTAGVISASSAKKANAYIKRHARDQILYTDDSEYGHDYVIAFKKH